MNKRNNAPKKKRNKLIYVTPSDSKEVRAIFWKIRKNILKTGGKSSLATSLSQYKKETGKRGKQAEIDYYRDWSLELHRIYKNLGRRAKRVTEKIGEEFFTPTTFHILPGRSKINMLRVYKEYINTLANKSNPNYIKTALTSKEERMIRKADKYGNYGIRSTIKKPVTLKTFGGSIAKLAYNNFIVSLQSLGYANALEYALAMSVDSFIMALKEHAHIIELVYKYLDVQVEQDSIASILWEYLPSNVKLQLEPPYIDDSGIEDI